MTGSGIPRHSGAHRQDPMTMMKAVRHEIWATDSNVALTFTGTLESYIASSPTPGHDSAFC